MPITPLDINVSVNKLPEVLKAHQENANKSFINSSNGEVQADKEKQHEKESVNSANKDQKLKNDKKHSGGGQHGSKKRDKKSADEPEEIAESKKEHVIDIRI